MEILFIWLVLGIVGTLMFFVGATHEQRRWEKALSDVSSKYEKGMVIKMGSNPEDTTLHREYMAVLDFKTHLLKELQ